MPMTLQRLLLAIIAATLMPAAAAAENIKIGFPMPLSGPASVYGVPVTKGAEMAVQEINAGGGVLGRKLELLTRDSKASADEAVRLARELIIKDNVDFRRGASGIDHRQGKQNRLHRSDVEDHPADVTGQPPSLYLPPRLQHRYRWPHRRVDHRELEGGETGRDHRARLCLWPRRHCRLCRLHQKGAARHRDRRPAMAEARPERLHAVHHGADGEEAGRGILRCIRR